MSGGVFMPVEEKGFSLRDLARGLLGWTVCSIVLLLAGSLLFSVDLIKMPAMEYASSLIAFLSAAAAGLGAASARREKKLFASLILGLVLSSLLLLLGFLISGKLEFPAGIRLFAFTLGGCLFGTLLSGKSGRRKHTRKRRSLT